MKIAVIGPGAMGLLFGGYLSQKHEVTLIGTNAETMASIAENGMIIRETDNSEKVYRPKATSDASSMAPVDLVILFVKAVSSEKAMDTNRHLIGKNTLLLTLQNGAGHEGLLSRYADKKQIMIGTTKEGSYRLTKTSICHSGKGSTAIGAISGSSSRFAPVAKALEECGFPCELTDSIQGMIWEKLMINASSSVLSGILQVPQGYIIQNQYAWNIAQKLITEICAVATADGYPFRPEDQIRRIWNHLEKAPDGYTSIYADLKAGRITEAPVISGAVVNAAHRLGVSAPTHEIILDLVHAMENKTL